MLKKCLEYEASDVRAKVFDAVISMCSVRIIERLGMGKSKMGKEQKSIRDVLGMVIEDLRHQSRPVQDIVHKVKAVITLIDAWSKHKVVSRLGPIVDGMHDLCHSAIWEPFVASIPGLKLQKSQIDRLEKTVSKLARYRDVSTYLYRTARRHSIARTVRVVAVDLPPSLFGKTDPSSYVPELIQAINRAYGNTRTLVDVCRVLKIPTSQAVALFKKTASSVRKESAIHAEVQLVTYCNLELIGPRPRVICSSKKACFLCNLLIKTHGKIYTPYSHGRLYTGWRLPKLPDTQLARQLNVAIRDVSRQSLEAMRRKSKKIKYPYPDESAVHTLILSSTTVTELTFGQQEEARPSEDVGQISEKEIDISERSRLTENTSTSATSSSLRRPAEREESATSSPAHGDSGNAECLHRNEELDDTRAALERSHGPNSTHEPISRNTTGFQAPILPVPSKGCEKLTKPEKMAVDAENSNHHLHPGGRRPRRLALDENSQLFSTDTFDLLVERDTAGISRDSTKRLACELVILTADEAKSVRDEYSSFVVNVESLDQVSLPLDSCMRSPFFLSDGGCMLQVSIRDNGDVK